MRTEIDSDNYQTWLATATECRNLIFQGLDLSKDDAQLAALPQAQNAEEGNLYLGCVLGNALGGQVATHFGMVFPRLQGHAFEPFPSGLYTWETLLNGYNPEKRETYDTTTDWLAYLSYIIPQAPGKPVKYVKVDLEEVLARRLHDHFITDEMEEFLEAFRPPHGKGIVAIMGGHDRARSDAIFAKVARMARTLTRLGFLIASGGGPGLMEAANLGAWSASLADDILESVIKELATSAPSYKDKEEWLSSAWKARQRHEADIDPTVSRSLGIPTWFYGHEPPNIFATHIAKYFENSLREEGLLAIATHGVVFAEGNAGTVQEIFQDACQNYYVNYNYRSPMILFGSNYWEQMPDKTGTYPIKAKDAFGLLRVLAREKGFEDLILSTDDEAEVVAKIETFIPDIQPSPTPVP